jgi:hypothetical protein
MSNIHHVSPKRTGPTCSVLVVICRKRMALAQSLKAEEANGFQKAGQSEEGERLKRAREFTEISACFSLEVVHELSNGFRFFFVFLKFRTVFPGLWNSI